MINNVSCIQIVYESFYRLVRFRLTFKRLCPVRTMIKVEKKICIRIFMHYTGFMNIYNFSV